MTFDFIKKKKKVSQLPNTKLKVQSSIEYKITFKINLKLEQSRLIN